MVSSRYLYTLLFGTSLAAVTELNAPSPPVLKCGAAKIDIDVSKAFLIKHNIMVKDSSELHFSKHKDCFAVDTGSSYKLQIFAPFTSCGTIVEHGNDDYAYTNEVVFENADRELSVFQFRCIYEDKYIVSSGPISPTKRTLQFHSGEGEFEVAMQLYRGPSFSFMDKHTDNPTVRLNDPVFVDIEFTSNLGFGDPGRDLVTSIKSCYATDTPEFSAHNRYHPLISGMCVSPEDESVEILENGNSDSARFKFNMFKWKGVIAYIYLHCEVHLCNSTIESCRHDEKMCHNRNQRKKRGIQLPSIEGPLKENNHRARSKRQNQSQKYSIEADLGDLIDDDEVENIGESNVYYDLPTSSMDSGASFEDIQGMLSDSDNDYFDIPEEEEMTDFITRGPIIFDDDDDVGSGQINSTIVEIPRNDEFLRVMIFSSIAIVICIIAMIMAILVALKRRKAGLEKLAGINQAFGNGYTRQSYDGSQGNNTNHTDLSQKASIITGVSNYDNFEGKQPLPAITGLPLPPTPEISQNNTNTAAVPGGPLPALPNLPPVLGSPVTTSSTIMESARDNKSGNSGPPSNSSGSDIYHNIVNNKINTKQLPEIGGHRNSGLSHTMSSIQQMQKPNIRPMIQKAESSRLVTRPNLIMPHSNNKVERSKTSINPTSAGQHHLRHGQGHHHHHSHNKHVHGSSAHIERSNTRANRGVEANTISHTLSNFSQ